MGLLLRVLLLAWCTWWHSGQLSCWCGRGCISLCLWFLLCLRGGLSSCYGLHVFKALGGMEHGLLHKVFAQGV